MGIKLTPRERELIEAYIDSSSVKEAARKVGMAHQNAKNTLMAARQRNRAPTTRELIYRMVTG